jgi:hypothetical protein
MAQIVTSLNGGDTICRRQIEKSPHNKHLRAETMKGFGEDAAETAAGADEGDGVRDKSAIAGLLHDSDVE